MLPTANTVGNEGWQRFAIGWFLLWPGWLIANTLPFLLSIEVRALAVLMFLILAIGQYLSILSLPSKRFAGFQVAVARTDEQLEHSIRADEALSIASRLLFRQGALLLLLYSANALIRSQWNADRSLLSQMATPWLLLFVIGPGAISSMIDRPYPNFRLQLIPCNRVP